MEDNELEELESEEVEDYSPDYEEEPSIEEDYVDNSSNSATSFLSNINDLRQKTNDLSEKLNKNKTTNNPIQSNDLNKNKTTNQMANSSIKSNNLNKNVSNSDGSKIAEKLGKNSGKLSALKQAMNYKNKMKQMKAESSEGTEANLDPKKQKAVKNETKRQVAGDMAKEAAKAIISKIPPALKLKILLVIAIIAAILLIFLAIIAAVADMKYDNKAATVSYISTGKVSYRGSYYDITGYLVEAGYCDDEDCNEKNAYRYISGINELFEDYSSEDCTEAGYEIDKGVNLIVATATYERNEEDFFGLDKEFRDYSSELDVYLEEYENLIEASFEEEEVETDDDTLTCYSFNENKFKDYVVGEEGYFSTYRDDLGSLEQTDRNNHYEAIANEADQIKETIEYSNNRAEGSGGGAVTGAAHGIPSSASDLVGRYYFTFDIESRNYESGTLFGQCVWYAQHRAMEILSNSPLDESRKQTLINSIHNTRGDGGDWYSSPNSTYFQKTTDINSPKAGSIVSWRWKDDKCRRFHGQSCDASHPNYGHVGIIEAVRVNENGETIVTLTEGWRSGASGGEWSVTSDIWSVVKFSKKDLTLSQLEGYSGYFNGYVYLY